jgi:cytidylate kinase
MYRSITWKALENNIAADDGAALKELVLNTQLAFGEGNHILIDNEDRENEIRSPRVSSQVSSYCTLPEVRAELTQKQREVGYAQNCVLDGRDIGTVVFPDATYKFFLQADYRVRAERRLAELQAKGEKISLEEVEANLRSRDEQDSNREVAPLRKADDAIEIDTTHTTIDEQVEKVLSFIRGE